MALKLRAQRPPAQGGGAADKEAGQRGNAILLYLCAPGRFKRRLGGTAGKSGSGGTRIAMPRHFAGASSPISDERANLARLLADVFTSRTSFSAPESGIWSVSW